MEVVLLLVAVEVGVAVEVAVVAVVGQGQCPPRLPSLILMVLPVMARPARGLLVMVLPVMARPARGLLVMVRLATVRPAMVWLATVWPAMERLAAQSAPASPSRLGRLVMVLLGPQGQLQPQPPPHLHQTGDST